MRCWKTRLRFCGMMALLPGVAPSLHAQNESAHLPGPRSGRSLVYHERLRKVVLLDGTDSWLNEGRTVLWTWDGRSWQPVRDSAGPRARYVGAAVYDSRGHQIVSYGGRVGIWEDVEGDTWIWNGSWREAVDSSAQRRQHHALAFDAARNKVVMFGGGQSPAPPGPWSTETWEWSGGKWSRVATQGPLGRVTSMVYDEKRREVVLFGGVGEPSGGRQPFYGDTWIWNGSSWRRASTSGPPPRADGALVYDRQAGVVLMYGGYNADSTGRRGPLGDFWKWDGERWSAIPQSGATPGLRGGAGLAYDAARSRTVLVGGARPDLTRADFPSDVWEWDGRGWTRIPSGEQSWPAAVPGWPEFVRVFERDGVDAAIERFRPYGRSYWEMVLVQAAQQLARPERNVDVVPVYLAGLRHRSGSAMMLHNLASTYASRGDTLRAIEFYRKTLDGLSTDSTILAPRRARIRQDATTRIERLQSPSPGVAAKPPR